MPLCGRGRTMLLLRFDCLGIADGPLKGLLRRPIENPATIRQLRDAKFILNEQRLGLGHCRESLSRESADRLSGVGVYTWRRGQAIGEFGSSKQ